MSSSDSVGRTVRQVSLIRRGGSTARQERANDAPSFSSSFFSSFASSAAGAAPPAAGAAAAAPPDPPDGTEASLEVPSWMSSLTSLPSSSERSLERRSCSTSTLCGWVHGPDVSLSDDGVASPADRGTAGGEEQSDSEVVAPEGPIADLLVYPERPGPSAYLPLSPPLPAIPAEMHARTRRPRGPT